MRHILGMAKRHLDLKGAKAPKLELDFLRLVYAVQHIRNAGDEAKGYLLVVTPEICARTEKWIKKYESGDSVDVLVVDLTDIERDNIEGEIQRNTAGMLAGTQGESAGPDSVAGTGALVEAKLAPVIGEREPAAVKVTDPAKQPLGIRWDYYGTFAKESGTLL